MRAYGCRKADMGDRAALATEDEVSWERVASHRGARRVLISGLRAGDSPRLNGEDAEHIEILAASDSPMPPILVHHGTMRVIDGMHRLRVAMLKGQQSIEVRFFEGSEADAFIRAVKANIAHGLPLTLADREAAAERILAARPESSDRSIGAITGLSAGTVGMIRSRSASAGSQVTARIGRDGRVRPANSADGRRIASEAIAKYPEASLREIAKVAGVSPTTVRDVRDRLRRGDDPVPPRQATRRGPTASALTSRRGAYGRPARSRASLLRDLRKDPSLRFSESGRTVLRWLDEHAKGPGPWQDVMSATPPHCAYLIAEMARGCAADWLELASSLEARLNTIERKTAPPDIEAALT